MKKIGIAIGILAILVIGGFLIQSVQQDNEAAPSDNNATGGPAAPSASKSPEAAGDQQEPASSESPPAELEPAIAYCEKAANDNASSAATRALADKGGLVAILQHEAALGGDPYTCGDYYLAHGGDIDATDPRTDSEHLTPLLFAIKRNDPRMVDYVIDHDADLRKRGGPNDVRPYGYAVFLALQNRSTNYNPVIAQLDKALKASAASGS
ncbi:MAG: hypothetical protein CMP08_03340 [Xanthomonadales bacterium]|nr:hypothetical protein [Xanthomonadales bacterium]